MCKIFECEDNEDIIDEFISDIRLFFTPQVSDGISVEEIVEKCIYEVWEYMMRSMRSLLSIDNFTCFQYTPLHICWW